MNEADEAEVDEASLDEEKADEAEADMQEVPEEESASEEKTAEDDFDFDNAIAAVAYSMLGDTKPSEDVKEKVSEEDYSFKEEDEEDELGFAAPDYDPDEEFERDEMTPPDDDDDEWNELITRKSRLNKIKK